MKRSHEEIMQDVNYDESRVPDYTLPSVLDGVTTASDWVMHRRREVLDFYRHEVYGMLPPRPDGMRVEVLSERDDALENTALRKELRVHFTMNNGRRRFMDMLLYIPKEATEPVPVFLGLCFKGKHVTTDETDVAYSGMLFHPTAEIGEDKRGIQVHRWQFREAIKRGYASATICYHDIFPDRANGWGESIYGLFYDDFAEAHRRHSSIGAWAWGLSRALDALETVPMVDTSRAAVHGHSRLGKTALWAGACDTRFRLVISNDSGCGGAALFKRVYGENVEAIVGAMPHWFVSSFEQYVRNEQAMPFDQHFLVSLMAPRAVAIASATEDLWADPRGEFLSGVHASAVYRLFGSKGLPTAQFPAPDVFITGDVSYHLRTGKHDQTQADWAHYFDLGDRYLK